MIRSGGGGASLEGRLASFDVNSLGETMLRLSVAGGDRIANATSFRVHVGGAESNVVSALAQLGRPCAWFGAVPDGPLGRHVLGKLRETGVDTTSAIVVEGARLGIYFFEASWPPVPSSVIYDRQASAFARLSVDDVDIERLLDSHIVHLTGITPALGEEHVALANSVVSEAKKRGVLVSFDVNYRQKLWPESQATRELGSLVADADIVFCSLRDAIRLFGAPDDAAGALEAVSELTRAGLIVVTLGAEGVIARAGDTTWSIPAVATTVIDRPGAGDALVAGVLDGYLEGDIEAGLSRGAVLAAIALSHAGDMITTTRGEINVATSSRGMEVAR